MQPFEGEKNIDKINILFENFLSNLDFIGLKIWGNPGGKAEVKTYRVNSCILIAPIEWDGNRRGIMTTIKDESKNKVISQIFEMTLPYEFSKRCNTRVYEKDNNIEIRNYGGFTIGKRKLKQQFFFEFLKRNNHTKDIFIDEEYQEYLKILEIFNITLSKKYFIDKIVETTYLIKEYKDYAREYYK